MIRLPHNPRKRENEDRFPSHAGETPCIVCGKPTTDDTQALFLHVANGDGPTGLAVLLPTENVDSADDLGLFPVGAACVRKHPELKPYVHRAGWK